jgi:uncharacterized glyoxalase superfamily protein PhnB
MSSEAPRVYATFRYREAAKMIDWLCRAFGFTVRVRYGKGRMVGAPGGGGRSTYIAVDDADAAFARAKAAGATILEEPVDRDYGSRDFICADPEGNVWSFGTYWPKADEAGQGL